MRNRRYKPICVILTVFCLVALVLPCSAAAEKNEELSKEAILASLWEADILQIKEAYAQGFITCSELTAYYLERIAQYNESYNCFVILCDDALEQAALADEELATGDSEKLLLGIPIVVKDNMDYVGYRTTNGYEKQGSKIAKSNAKVLEYLLQEGAIVIGKTNMSAGAMDHRTSFSYSVGHTKNAYNPFLSPAGSSGGSAAAVCLNFAVAGLGTDTNSSLRLPAAFNGCVSLRVTTKLLPMTGISKCDSGKDVPGVITRSVMDQAILLDVMSGGTTQYAENLNSEVLSGLKLGVLKELSGAYLNGRTEKNIDTEILTAFHNAIDELRECGAEIVEISIPNVFSLSRATYQEGAAISKMYAKVEKAVTDAQVDALIFPSYLSTPLRLGRDENGVYWNPAKQTMINNTSKFSSCAGLPEISVPIGQHSLGAGIGLEIAALRNQEQLLLDIAYAYTLRYDHRASPENAPDLYAQYYEGNVYQLVEKLNAVPEETEPMPEEKPDIQPLQTEPVSSTDPTQEGQADIPSNRQMVWVLTGGIIFAFLAICSVFVLIKRKKRKEGSV